ncbi:MAG: hypothetical protein AAGK22_30165 [Acidobacteriota bacterium]
MKLFAAALLTLGVALIVLAVVGALPDSWPRRPTRHQAYLQIPRAVYYSLGGAAVFAGLGGLLLSRPA